MLRINTPERGQRGYSEATEALRKLVAGKEVVLVFEEPGKPTRGNYGRLLAYVYVDGKNINLEMVRLGWTKFYTKYGRGRFAKEFETAEREARENKRGLWR